MARDASPAAPTHWRPALMGKVAIVTGAGSPEGGVGRAVAMLLAAEGARVAVLDIDGARAQEVVNLIENIGGIAVALKGDVTDSQTCTLLVEQSVCRLGRLDILVNNVGVSGTATTLRELDHEAVMRTFSVNLHSAIAMTAAAIAPLTQVGGGAIVNIASVAGMQAYGNVGYGPSKAALIAFTRETAVMHGRDGIRANVVAPGHIHTPHVGGLVNDELRQARRRVGPLGVEGDASDVAQAVLYLASDAARFITGVVLPVDGGVTMLGPLAGYTLVQRD